MRAVSDATLVCKRGAEGAVAFEGAIPDSLDDGQTGPGFPIEVFNVLGAGDGFFSGLLRGWLTDQDWPTSLKFANACGAFAVSRHGCTPAYPSLTELEFFLERGVVRPDLRNDAALEQVHWATNRQREHGGDWSEMRVFAFDHRMQLEEMDGRDAREDRRLQAALPPGGARGARTAAPATASSATTGSAARRCTRPPAPGSGSAGPANGPARGR